MIRVDPTEMIPNTGINSLKIRAFSSIDVAIDDYSGVPDVPAGNGVLVLTHDLSKTGAPILAFNIAKSIRKMDVPVATLVASMHTGDILGQYAENNLRICPLNYTVVGSAEEAHACTLLLSHLKNRGYRSAVLNTVVSARYAKDFKAAGFQVVSLIHETKETSVIHGFDKYVPTALGYSDHVVFPAECVKDGMCELADEVRAEVLVRPQGVYMPRAASSQVDAKGLCERLV